MRKSIRNDVRNEDVISGISRTCDICGKPMCEGFLIYDSEYYCSEKCLSQVYSDEEYDKIYDSDEGCWTEWED